MDIQSIYDTIPLSIRKPKLTKKAKNDEIPSLFEIVNYNINKPALNERYKKILAELNESDPILLDLLILSCYLHSCRVPVSFEVTSSYLGEEADDYEEVLDIMDSLKGMVTETIGTLVDEFDNDQDYYKPRSQILSETIILQTKSEYFKRVFERFHDNVPSFQIPNYYIFKRRGYDASYVSKAYNNWKEGLDFYEKSFGVNPNPFLLQQCSLYLLKKRKFTEAALKIDRARQISKKKIFSIENTHAIILFKANINSESDNDEIRFTLDRSMEILKKCYYDDQRKTYHAVTFAEQAMEYYSKFPDSKSIDYITLAIEWLKEVQEERKYYHRIRKILKSLEDAL